VIRDHRIGEPADARQRRQIGLIEGRRGMPRPHNLVGKRLGARGVAAVNQHARPLARESSSDIAANAVGRAGDQNGFPDHCHSQ
jgi:hypothetical protein